MKRSSHPKSFPIPEFGKEVKEDEGVYFLTNTNNLNSIIYSWLIDTKVEKILISDEELEKGFDSDEIDIISANIINERNPTCYGSDIRWANHLFSIAKNSFNIS